MLYRCLLNKIMPVPIFERKFEREINLLSRSTPRQSFLDLISYFADSIIVFSYFSKLLIELKSPLSSNIGNSALSPQCKYSSLKSGVWFNKNAVLAKIAALSHSPCFLTNEIYSYQTFRLNGSTKQAR